MRGIWAMLFVLCFAAIAAAQSPVTMTVEPARAFPGQTVQLILESSGSLDASASPTVSDSSVMRISPQPPSTSFQSSMINGRMQKAVNRRIYLMQALKPGSYTVSLTGVTMDGKSITVTPVQGTVEAVPEVARKDINGSIGVPLLNDPGRSRALADQLFTIAEVSNTSPLVGEAFEVNTYIVVSASARLGDFVANPASEKPDNPAFVLVPDSVYVPNTVSREPVVIDGQNYGRYFLQRLTLVATRSGDFNVNGAEIQMALNTRGGMFFSGYDFQFSAPSLPIKVRPLPEAPASVIAQLVGDFTIGTTVDRNEVDEGDLVTFELRISGKGYLDTVGIASLPAVDGLVQVSSEVDPKSTIASGSLVSTKVFKYIYQANAAGTLTIPALAFALVNPKTGEQVIRNTEALPVTVHAAKKSTVMLTPDREVGSRGAAKRLSSQGVMYIDDAPLTHRTLANVRLPLVRQPWFWAAHLLPLLLVCGFGGWTAVRRHRESDAAGTRARAARQRGATALREASRLAATGPAADFYAALANGVMSHVSSVLGRRASGLTSEEAAEGLRAAGREDLAKSLGDLLRRFDSCRYAPSVSDENRASDLASAERFVAEVSRVRA